MHAAAKFLLLALLAGLAACSGDNPQQAEVNNSAVAADIETLPPDESVVTPTDELANGVANAEDAAPADNSY